MDLKSQYHTPVLVDEVLAILSPVSGGLYLDGTAGGGGHALALLEASSPGGRVLALDRDSRAVRETRERLSGFGDRIRIEQANFHAAPEIFPGMQFNGALLDLGVSSHQIDSPERGFSIDRDGPLDMRMGCEEGSVTAAEFLSLVSETDLNRLLRDLGETPFHRRIAESIVRERQNAAIDTTARLAGIVRATVPFTEQRKSLVQVFQALRIAVNDELGALALGLEKLFDSLATGGRFAVISYHSLEDRMVKRFFRDREAPCTCPPGLPVCACGLAPLARVLTRKPVRPTDSEVERNPRSRSARLRAAERLAA